VEGGDPATLELPEMRRAPGSSPIQAPEFVLFVNNPSLLNETYRRYLEARIRETEPYPGLPIILTLRARAKNVSRR
jgi:Predicted GTPases